MELARLQSTYASPKAFPSCCSFLPHPFLHRCNPIPQASVNMTPDIQPLLLQDEAFFALLRLNFKLASIRTAKFKTIFVIMFAIFLPSSLSFTLDLRFEFCWTLPLFWQTTNKLQLVDPSRNLFLPALPTSVEPPEITCLSAKSATPACDR